MWYVILFMTCIYYISFLGKNLYLQLWRPGMCYIFLYFSINIWHPRYLTSFHMYWFIEIFSAQLCLSCLSFDVYFLAFLTSVDYWIWTKCHCLALFNSISFSLCGNSLANIHIPVDCKEHTPFITSLYILILGHITF